MLVSAWNAFTTETIVNCFRKAGISAENQDAAIAEEDNPLKDLQDEIDDVRTVQPNLIPEDINAASLVDVDAEVSAMQPPPTDAEILADFLETDNISDDGFLVFYLWIFFIWKNIQGHRLGRNIKPKPWQSRNL